MSSERLTINEMEVMLAIHGLEEEAEKAYGSSIVAWISQQTGTELPMNTVYSCLNSLEERGCIKTWIGEPKCQRGGKAQRLCSVCDRGKCMLLDQLRELDSMRRGIFGRVEGGAHA